LNYDPRYRPGSFIRRGSSQLGRLFASPLGVLKLVGALILMLLGIFAIVALLGFLLSGHISHV
jgi:hypothetical protein